MASWYPPELGFRPRSLTPQALTRRPTPLRLPRAVGIGFAAYARLLDQITAPIRSAAGRRVKPAQNSVVGQSEISYQTMAPGGGEMFGHRSAIVAQAACHLS